MFHTRSANAFAQRVASVLPLTPLHQETCVSVVARSYDAVRDTAYAVVDFPRMIFKANSGYSNYKRYTKQMRKHGKVNPDDFKDIDVNELRVFLEHHYTMRGPLQNINYNYFNYMYVIMGAIVLYVAYGLNKQLNERLDNGGYAEDRISAFSDNHEE